MRRQGTLTKVYIDGSKRKPVERHLHLLSDALIYSAKMMGPYKYKASMLACKATRPGCVPCDALH